MISRDRALMCAHSYCTTTMYVHGKYVEQTMYDFDMRVISDMFTHILYIYMTV